MDSDRVMVAGTGFEPAEIPSLDFRCFLDRYALKERQSLRRGVLRSA